MIERIRLRYALGYDAPAAQPGTLRHIQLRLTPAARRRSSHAKIRARSGYYAAQP